MFGWTLPRYPENGQTRRVRVDLEQLLPYETIETNVPVVRDETGSIVLSDIDLLIVGKAIVLLKTGSGKGQLVQAEHFSPRFRDGTPNPDYLIYNPERLPVVVYVTRMGTYLENDLREIGVRAFGGGQTAEEREERYRAFLEFLAAMT